MSRRSVDQVICRLGDSRISFLYDIWVGDWEIGRRGEKRYLGEVLGVARARCWHLRIASFNIDAVSTPWSAGGLSSLIWLVTLFLDSEDLPCAASGMHGSSQAKTSPNVKLCVLIPSFRKDASGFREVEDESPHFPTSTLPFLPMSRPGPTSTKLDFPYASWSRQII